jgi:hypothetical protein
MATVGLKILVIFLFPLMRMSFPRGLVNPLRTIGDFMPPPWGRIFNELDDRSVAPFFPVFRYLWRKMTEIVFQPDVLDMIVLIFIFLAAVLLIQGAVVVVRFCRRWRISLIPATLLFLGVLFPLLDFLVLLGINIPAILRLRAAGYRTRWFGLCVFPPHAIALLIIFYFEI